MAIIFGKKQKPQIP